MALAYSTAYPNTHINTGNKAYDIVQVARTQVGYKEGDGNDTKYGAYFGWNGVAWCALFICWCARQANISDKEITLTSYAASDDLGLTFFGRNAARTVDITYVPAPGDIIVYDWESDGFCYKEPASFYGDHVGIVEYVENGNVHTIEGNYSDSVKARVIPLTDINIKGYGVADYNLSHKHKYTSKVTQKATCTKNGSKRYTCSCGNYYDEVIKAGHTVVNDSMTEATCLSTGLTAGTHCSVCGKVIKAQEVIPVKAHTPVPYDDQEATCTEDGIAGGTYCSVCLTELTPRVPVAATGHIPEPNVEVEPTCTGSGLTGGTHCSVCMATLTKAKNVAPLGHRDDDDDNLCDRCGNIMCHHTDETGSGYCDLCHENICEHTETVLLNQVELGCETDGYTGDEVCSKCGFVFEEGEFIPSTGHCLGEWTVTIPTSYVCKGTERRTCLYCEMYEERDIEKLPMKKLSACTVSVTGSAVYTKKALKPAVTVKDGKTKLLSGTHYKVTYKNNTAVGTATVTVTGIEKNGYSGTVTKKFKIVPAKVTGLKATKTDSTVTLKWTKVTGAGKYVVYLYNSSKKTYTKKATVTTNKATLKKLSAGTAYKYSVLAVIGSAKGEKSSVLKVVTDLAKPSPAKLKQTKKGCVKATWDKVPGATGYIVYYARGKEGKFVRFATVTKPTYTKTNLTKGRSCWIKVKAFKIVGDVTVYSPVSTAKGYKLKY